MVKFGPTTCHIVSSMSGSGGGQVQIQRQYHIRGTDPDLHRMIAFVEDLEGMYMYILYIPQKVYVCVWCVCS